MHQVGDNTFWDRLATEMNAVQSDLKARYDEVSRRKRALMDALEQSVREPAPQSNGLAAPRTP